MTSYKTPAKYRQYEWISNRMKKIKDVNFVAILQEGEEVFMFLSNNKQGKEKKEYHFPLRTGFFVDFTMAADCPCDYDIMDIDDPQAMVEVIHAKAYQFFNNATVH